MRLEILRVIRKTLREASAEDTILIHYSGHGKPDRDGSLHFIAADSYIEDLPDTSVRANDVHKAARESYCRAIILLLDCCYAGAIGQAMNAGIKGETADLLQQQLRLTAQNAKGLFILTSSTAWQTSEEAENERNGRVMGRFTRAVVECLTAVPSGFREEILFSDLATHVANAFKGQDVREFRADAQGDLIIARAPRPVFHPLADVTGGEAFDGRHFETLLDIGPDIQPRAVTATKATPARPIGTPQERAASLPSSPTQASSHAPSTRPAPASSRA